MQERVTLAYCQANYTKRSSKGFKTVCPSCSGHDLWVTQPTAYCFECSVSYRVVENLDDPIPEYTPSKYIVKPYDTKAIRQTYNDAAHYYHSCITPEHEAFLKTRGITTEAINFYKIGFCSTSSHPMYLTETAKEAGLADSRGTPWLAGRIVFPYFGDGEVTDLRGRALTDCNAPRYKSLYHKSEQRGAIYPYNYDVALQRAMKTGSLVVTEGEVKAIVASMQGFAIMALPGMLSYKPALVQQLGIKIVVMFDSNSAPEDRVRVDRAIAKFSTHIPQFSVVTLPLLGKDKMDVDSYLLSGDNTSRFQHFIDNAIAYKDYQKLRSF